MLRCERIQRVRENRDETGTIATILWLYELARTPIRAANGASSPLGGTTTTTEWIPTVNLPDFSDEIEQASNIATSFLNHLKESYSGIEKTVAEVSAIVGLDHLPPYCMITPNFSCMYLL